MIFYVDTSALVKLYVDERESEETAQFVAGAASIVTSRVTYPEVRAAFARRRRQGDMTSTVLRQIVEQFDRDFEQNVIVELTPEVAALAGVLAERHSLRGFDAIHLASAVDFSRISSSPLNFLAYDATLMRAAAAEGLVDPRKRRK